MIPAACLLLPALLFAIVPARAAEVLVKVTRSGDALQVEASAEIRSGIARTWQVLTGYDRYAEFIPDMQTSRVISRDGNRVEVEQKGQARMLFVGFPIDVRLAVIEHPYERIVSRAAAGNFREMAGEYRLEEVKGGVLLHYKGSLIPDFAVPPLLGTWIFGHSIEATFAALVAEIERQPAPQVLPKDP